ncbi:hypothetical protein HELRODRAFT_174165 [Helobdella robusta]|uniref:Uncharacterized protein n=1 Tax=Helobdella robusta TaxID=6412 RepID=T1F7Q1_HELRO|nr:hypothetical protein HELRODRAFT_174165 [Helobdella robusta]ESO02759.1 hypothetical protein HELRODRAFT_174165 [Helobdella robusta]
MALDGVALQIRPGVNDENVGGVNANSIKPIESKQLVLQHQSERAKTDTHKHAILSRTRYNKHCSSDSDAIKTMISKNFDNLTVLEKQDIKMVDNICSLKNYLKASWASIVENNLTKNVESINNQGSRGRGVSVFVYHSHDPGLNPTVSTASQHQDSGANLIARNNPAAEREVLRILQITAISSHQIKIKWSFSAPPDKLARNNYGGFRIYYYRIQGLHHHHHHHHQPHQPQNVDMDDSLSIDNREEVMVEDVQAREVLLQNLIHETYYDVQIRIQVINPKIMPPCRLGTSNKHLPELKACWHDVELIINRTRSDRLH